VRIKRPSQEQLDATETQAEPAPKLSFFTRLKLKFRHQPKVEISEESDEPPRSASVKQSSATPKPAADTKQKRLRDEDVAEPEVEPAPKLSFLARLKQKFHRQPKLEALEDSDEEAPNAISKPSSSAKQRATREEEDTQEPELDEVVKVGFFKRLLNQLSRKWVWIPSVSLIVLALIGGVAFMLVQASHEKAKLKLELQKAQKKIEQQAAVVKEAAAVKQAAEVVTAPDQPSTPAIAPPPPMIGAANSETKPGVNAGDCLVTSKESVAASLKGCIDSFNAKARTQAPEKKP